jgi:hypothetical protein
MDSPLARGMTAGVRSAMDDVCPQCEKLSNLCVCEAVEPVDNRIFVLILRHPQEQDRKLGTAKIATLQLKNSALKTGLSWANLKKASGQEDPRSEKMGNPLSGNSQNVTASAACAADCSEPQGRPGRGSESSRRH